MVCLQAAFVAEDVTSITKESIDAVLQSQQFDHRKVSDDLATALFQQSTSLQDLDVSAGWSVDIHLS